MHSCLPRETKLHAFHISRCLGKLCAPLFSRLCAIHRVHKGNHNKLNYLRQQDNGEFFSKLIRRSEGFIIYERRVFRSPTTYLPPSTAF